MAREQQGGLYPMDASITDMGLDKIEVQMLTKKAKSLHKRDLIVLREVAKEYRTQGEDKVIKVFDQRTGLDLDVGDLSSVAHAFDDMQDRLNSTPNLTAAAACCCCTCCPCCSCTASVVIEATL